MVFGNDTPSTCASGSAFSLPPSAITTIRAVCRARSSASRASWTRYCSCSVASRARSAPASADAVAPRASSPRSRSRIFSCSKLMAPMSPFSIARIWRRSAPAAGSQRSISGHAAASRATTAPPSSRAAMRPMRSPHSLRSITATSAGRSRRTTAASSTQTKSAP